MEEKLSSYRSMPAKGRSEGRGVFDHPRVMKDPMDLCNGREAEFIQIHASKGQIKNRIDAFCNRKHQSINDRNVRLFCGTQSIPEHMWDHHTSCARIDAVHFNRDGKSRWKVSTVHNENGPQLSHYELTGASRTEPQSDNETGANVEERISTIEQHCNMDGGSSKPVIERIKSLEDKILYLEGISPEYFLQPSQRHVISQKASPPQSRVSKTSETAEEQLASSDNKDREVSASKSSAGLEGLSLGQIDTRIRELKHKLRMKSMEMG